MIDVVLGYVIIMYHINQGIIHIYFLIFVFLGFILENILHKYVKLPKSIPVSYTHLDVYKRQI